MKVATPVGELEVVNVHPAGIEHHLGGTDVPKGIIENDVGGMDVDHRLQSRNGSRCLAPTAGNGLAGGFLSWWRMKRVVAVKLAAIGDGTVVAPIENRLEAVVLGTGFQGNIDSIVGMAVGEADTGMETVAGILAQ